MVSSEAAPWAKTGGLADVLFALPQALARRGHRVTVVIPKYRGVEIPAASSVELVVDRGKRRHHVACHVAAISPSWRVVFVDIPELFDRPGYYASGGHDYPDNAERFGFLAATALEFAERQSDFERIDVVHAHDWQAGLLPALLKTEAHRWPRVAEAGLVFTIHNLAYQGVFARDVVPNLGLDWRLFGIDAGEFYGQFSFLKAGITQSDFVTTVSPAYADETRRPDFGAGLDGVLRSRADRYLGILNGIDAETWNPATDPMLPAHFDAGQLAGKASCKRALLEAFGLPVGDDAQKRPLIGMVSRLVEQKGLDLIEAATPSMMALDATWIFIGSGQPRYETFLSNLAAKHPSRVSVRIGFDERLAHLVEAGADIFLMPSIFEPCGLNQMYSLRYGTVPVVHGVGGLDDTIRPYTSRSARANGFKFKEATGEALAKTLRQAVSVFEDRETWLSLMRQGMAEDHSWETSAKEYVKVYRRARRDADARGGQQTPS